MAAAEAAAIVVATVAVNNYAVTLDTEEVSLRGRSGQ